MISLTVTVHEAETVPSEDLTVIVAVPFALAVTNPLLFTDATLSLLELHDKPPPADEGVTVAVSWAVFPVSKLRLV